jgi:hypothetical protein
MQTPFSQSIDAFWTDAGPGLAKNESFHVPLNFSFINPQFENVEWWNRFALSIFFKN